MRAKTIANLATLLGLSLAAACSSSVDTTPTGSGGSSSTTGSSSSSGGGACAGFEDATSPSSVKIRFRNDSGLPIYLPLRCSSFDFNIRPTGGSDGVTYNFESSCLQTCEELQTQTQFSCGACAPTSYLIEPGAVHDVTWDGTGLFPDVGMPAACWKQPQGTTCPRIVSAPAASYTIEAKGFGSCGADCACDAQGVCAGDGQGLEAYPDTAKLNYPEENLVEVVFGVCAFGCAGGGV